MLLCILGKYRFASSHSQQAKEVTIYFIRCSVVLAQKKEKSYILAAEIKWLAVGSTILVRVVALVVWMAQMMHRIIGK